MWELACKWKNRNISNMRIMTQMGMITKTVNSSNIECHHPRVLNSRIESQVQENRVYRNLRFSMNIMLSKPLKSVKIMLINIVKKNRMNYINLISKLKNV